MWVPELEEYVLGAEALGKGETFDPKADPIVRVQMRRLRARLNGYYATEGRLDPIWIEIPIGSYTPERQFRRAILLDPNDARCAPDVLHPSGVQRTVRGGAERSGARDRARPGVATGPRVQGRRALLGTAPH